MPSFFALSSFPWLINDIFPLEVKHAEFVDVWFIQKTLGRGIQSNDICGGSTVVFIASTSE